MRTGKVTLAKSPLPLRVPLSGVKELKLVVEDCGDGVVGDIADWAGARLVK